MNETDLTDECPQRYSKQNQLSRLSTGPVVLEIGGKYQAPGCALNPEIAGASYMGVPEEESTETSQSLFENQLASLSISGQARTVPTHHQAPGSSDATAGPRQSRTDHPDDANSNQHSQASKTGTYQQFGQEQSVN